MLLVTAYFVYAEPLHEGNLCCRCLSVFAIVIASFAVYARMFAIANDNENTHSISIKVIRFVLTERPTLF